MFGWNLCGIDTHTNETGSEDLDALIIAVANRDEGRKQLRNLQTTHDNQTFTTTFYTSNGSVYLTDDYEDETYVNCSSLYPVGQGTPLSYPALYHALHSLRSYVTSSEDPFLMTADLLLPIVVANVTGVPASVWGCSIPYSATETTVAILHNGTIGSVARAPAGPTMLYYKPSWSAMILVNEYTNASWAQDCFAQVAF